MIPSVNFDLYLGLGTNLGDREANLVRAVSLLKERGGSFSIKAVSNIYETSPVGGITQPDYLNCVLLSGFYGGLHSHADGEYHAMSGRRHIEKEFIDLLFYLKNIENVCGRKKDSVRYSSRILDVDILYAYDNIEGCPVTVGLEDLKVPHTEITNRKFVIVPLLDIYCKKKDGLLPGVERLPFDGEKINNSLKKLNLHRQGLSQEIKQYGYFNDDMSRVIALKT